jgi:hypothetical protein
MNAARYRFFRLYTLGCIVLSLGFLALNVSAQTQPTHHTPAHATAAQPAGAPSKMKAIWEPMNYPDDILLQDVYFANDKVGWIAGKGPGGFIMHTADGGANWDFQMGDPHSSDPGISELRFVDATHGWAVQGGDQILRTTDGTTWQTVGPFAAGGGPVANYRFISANVGFELAGGSDVSTIYATHDAGRSWKPAYQCQVTLQVNGLSQNTGCVLRDVYFPSARIGYAVGGGYDGSWATFVKTVDGGASWKVIFASTEVNAGYTVAFLDDNNGVVRLSNKQILITADGGQTWNGATGVGWADVKFADPEVGWSCLEQYGPTCSITVDGGKNWTAHGFSLPSDIMGYSVPRRDRVFLVGDHGMIYRYRIVPASYTVQGIVDAPMVPAYGGALVGQLQQMQTQIAALQAKLGGAGAPASAGGGGGGSGPSGEHVAVAESFPQNGGFSQDTSGQTAPASGGFSQDTSAAGGATQDPAAATGGFVQDATAAPASSYVQSCCASSIQSLQTSFTAVATQIPQFGSQFKNLNLLLVGLNMVSQMITDAKQIKTEFVALKAAPNAQAALAALTSLSTSVASMSQSIDTQFQSLGAAPAAGAAADVIGNQAVGTSATGTSATPATSGQPANSSTAGTQSSTGSTAGSTASKVKKKFPPL